MASASILSNGKVLYAYNGTNWIPLNTTGNLVNSTRWQKVLSASATVLSGNDDTNESLVYTPGFEQVFLNGVLLARDLDYTATDGTTVTAASPILAGNLVEIVSYNNINVGNTYTQSQIDNKIANTFTRWVKTLSASATTLSGLDDNATTLDYTAGAEQVYVNGILLLPSEYTATSGSTVVLSEAAVSGDVIQVHTLKSFRIPNTYTITQADQLFIPDSIVDAKGDIITATADNTPARLAVGSASTSYLRPDPNETTGLKWDDDAWTAYTPTWTNLTVGNATQTFKYKQIGKTVYVTGILTFGSTTSMGTDPRFSLPVTASSSISVRANLGELTIFDSGTATYYGALQLTSTTNMGTGVSNSSTTYLSASVISATVPMTWTTSDALCVNFFYEAA